MKGKTSSRLYGSKPGKDPSSSGKGVLESYVLTMLREAAVKCALAERKEIHAATVIQSCVRSWFVQTTIGYELQHIRLERRAQAREQTVLKHKDLAATKIQALVKGGNERLRYTDYLENREDSAILIQSAVRGYIVRNNPFLRLAIHQRETKKSKAAAKIQARYKAIRAREEFGALILEARGAAFLAAPAQATVRIRPRSARPTPALTAVNAATHSALKDLLATEVQGAGLHLTHADVTLTTSNSLAEEPDNPKPGKIRLRPHSAPRLINPSGLRSTTQMRLHRAHNYCGDLPEMEQHLLSHVDQLRGDGGGGPDTPTYIVGEAGDIRLDEGTPPPWITPRLNIPPYMIRTGLGLGLGGPKKVDKKKVGAKKPPRPKRTGPTGPSAGDRGMERPRPKRPTSALSNMTV